jgi:hypothetical protein
LADHSARLYEYTICNPRPDFKNGKTMNNSQCTRPCASSDLDRHLRPWVAVLMAVVLSLRMLALSSEAADDPTAAAPHIYIPKDLEDCLRVLEQQVHSEDIQKIRDDSITVVDMHMGLGLRIRNEWLITRDDRGQGSRSRLAVYFRALGIDHPDDMSGIILESFVRHVKKKPIQLDEQVAYYKNYWAAGAK